MLLFLYLFYLLTFSMGLLALFAATVVLHKSRDPLIRFFRLVFIGLTVEMGVTLSLNFAIAAVPGDSVLWPPLLATLGLAVFLMSALLALATLNFFLARPWLKIVLLASHGLGFILLVATSRLDPARHTLQTGPGGFTLFLLPLVITLCLATFLRSLIVSPARYRSKTRKGLWLFLGVVIFFLPFFAESISQVALTPSVVLAPGFFPMQAMSTFYLGVSVVFLVFAAKQTKSSANATPKLDTSRWGPLYGISPRETEVVVLLLEGKDNKQIADELSIAPSTVKAHLTHLFQKTKTQSRFALIRFLERSDATKV